MAWRLSPHSASHPMKFSTPTPSHVPTIQLQKCFLARLMNYPAPNTLPLLQPRSISGPPSHCAFTQQSVAQKEPWTHRSDPRERERERERAREEKRERERERERAYHSWIYQAVLGSFEPKTAAASQPRHSFNALVNASLKSSGCAAAEQWFQKMQEVAACKAACCLGDSKLLRSPMTNMKELCIGIGSAGPIRLNKVGFRNCTVFRN